MATLSSSSTDAQVRAEFDDTASYEESNDLGLARRHVTACRIWLARHPRSSSRSSHTFELNSDLIQKSLEQARDFIDLNVSGNGGIIEVSFAEMRR